MSSCFRPKDWDAPTKAMTDVLTLIRWILENVHWHREHSHNWNDNNNNNLFLQVILIGSDIF